MPDSHGPRIEYVDALKGAIIIAIVFVHLTMLSGMERGGSAQEMPLVMQALYLGLMSYFIISGYFFRPGRGFSENMRRRGTQLVAALLICTLVLPAVLYLWATIFGKCPGTDDYVRAMMQCFASQAVFEDISVPLDSPLSSPTVGYYYLWAMVGAFVVFYAVADRIRGDLRLEAAAIVILLAVQCLYIEFIHLRLPLYFHVSPIAAAFMVLGMTLKEKDVLHRIGEFRVREAGFWGLFLGCLAGAAVLVYLLHPDVMFDLCYFGAYGGLSVFSYFAEASLMFVVLSYVMLFITKVPLLHIPFTEMGRHTLGTMLLHSFIPKMMLIPFFAYAGGIMPSGFGFFPSLAVAFADLILCYAVCRFGHGTVSRITGRLRNTSAPE